MSHCIAASLHAWKPLPPNAQNAQNAENLKALCQYFFIFSIDARPPFPSLCSIGKHRPQLLHCDGRKGYNALNATVSNMSRQREGIEGSSGSPWSSPLWHSRHCELCGPQKNQTKQIICFPKRFICFPQSWLDLNEIPKNSFLEKSRRRKSWSLERLGRKNKNKTEIEGMRWQAQSDKLSFKLSKSQTHRDHL